MGFAETILLNHVNIVDFLLGKNFKGLHKYSHIKNDFK